MARMKAASVGTRETDLTPDGRPIIAREYNAHAPHPHPAHEGRLVPTRGINKILVADPVKTDGVELYECDHCGKTADRAVSVLSHLPSHNPAKHEPNYDVKVLRALVDVVSKYKKARVRGYCERAAEELNTLGFTLRDGRRFTSNNVSQLYNHWKDRPEVTRRRTAERRAKSGDTENAAASRTVSPHSPKRAVVSPVSPQSPLAAVTDADHPIVQKLAELAAGIGDVALQLAKVTQELAALPIGEDTSADLREKAAKYDQLAGLLRG